MSILSPFLEVRNLTDLQLGQMWFILNSPAYTDVFEPYLLKMRDSLNKQLLNPTIMRKDECPDDYLRGNIMAIDGFLAFFKNIIEETKIEQVTRTLSPGLTSEQEYAKMQSERMTRPAGQTVQPTMVEELSPEDDY